MQNALMSLLNARRGHFLLESGHHGDLWLDLELLFLQPKHIEQFATELARRLEEYHIDAVCGPLVEGAFVGLLVANELGVEFVYTEQRQQGAENGLYAVGYLLPSALRQRVVGKRVAVVNDVINAGSAVRGTYLDLQACEANTVAVATLLVLGQKPKALADEWAIELITLGSQPNTIWKPEECPLCADGRSLDN